MTTNPGSLAIDYDKRVLICELCIEWVRFEDLHEDEYGNKWDVCQDCAEREEMIQGVA